MTTREMRSRRQTITRALGALVLGSVLVATTLTSAASAGGSGQPERLNVLIPSHADLLDPTRTSAQALGALLLGLEPLVRYDSDGTITPTLAESVDQPDPRTYVFTIRDGVTFWDGTDLTVEDVKFSIELHSSPDSESLLHPFWSDVESIEITGDRELTVTLNQPDPQFLYSVAVTEVVSQAFYEANGDSVGTPGTLNMGTGPYEFVSFTPSTETVLRANDNYWGEAPPYQELVLRTVGDDATRLTAMQSGEFDVIYNIPIAQLDAFSSIGGLTTADAPDLMLYKFNFDMTKPPWNDIHLRRAFTMAVNRQEIVDGALAGRAELAQSVVPREIMSTVLDEATVDEAYAALEEEFVFDLDVAREELAQSATPDGLDVELMVIGSDPNLSPIAQTAAQSLAEIGINLDIRQVDDNTYYEAVYFTHTTEGLSLDGFSGPNPAPISMPLYALHSAFGLPKGGQGSNISDYDNPEVDALLDEARQLAPDDPASGELILEALTATQQDPPMVPIAFPQIFVGVREGLQIADFDTFWWMTDWTREISAG